MIAFFILLALVMLLFLRVPVAFALGSLGIMLLWLYPLPLNAVPQRLYGTMDSFELLAVPMFLLMSNVLLKGGVGKDLFTAVQSSRWFGYCDYSVLWLVFCRFRIVGGDCRDHWNRCHS